MEKCGAELRNIVGRYAEKLQTLSFEKLRFKQNEKVWSQQEIIGHLIDSAHNNLRRFMSGQIEVNPQIVYDQELWVFINQYNKMNKEDIIQLWKLINERICAVLENTNEMSSLKTVNIGKESLDLKSIHWLADDYIKHLKHHLNQIFPGDFPVNDP